jgi:predicted oxidoreductase (fatty acid repression mutant protein)
MDILKNSQIEQEHESWQRTMEFLRQENALLKYRLSEMVDHNEENHFLQTAEYFQNELLIKDEMLKKLIDELQKYTELIKNNVSSKKIIPMHNKLRNEIIIFQKDYLVLSKNFNEKMLKIFKD